MVRLNTDTTKNNLWLGRSIRTSNISSVLLLQVIEDLSIKLRILIQVNDMRDVLDFKVRGV